MKSEDKKKSRMSNVDKKFIEWAKESIWITSFFVLYSERSEFRTTLM